MRLPKQLKERIKYLGNENVDKAQIMVQKSIMIDAALAKKKIDNEDEDGIVKICITLTGQIKSLKIDEDILDKELQAIVVPRIIASYNKLLKKAHRMREQEAAPILNETHQAVKEMNR
jgi:DNA-binding protein YbaB